MDFSNHYSLSHPTYIGQIHQNLAEEHLKRSALEMCCSDKVEQVKSSEYFYSMFEVLNGSNDKSLLRPKKFKRLKVDYSKNLEYKKLKTEKNKIKETLVEKLRNDKVESVKRLIIAGAQANRSFSDLFLPVLDKKFTETQSSLEKAYDDYRKFYQETTAIIQNLSNFFDPDKLSENQLISINFLQDNGKLQEWNDDNRKKEIFNCIKEIWPENVTMLYDMYVKTESKRDMLNKFGETIKKKIEEKKMDGKKLTRNLVCQKMCEYIWENMRITETKYDTSIIDKFFTGKEAEGLLNEYAKAQIECDIEKLKIILKEQKQHTFARFCQLTEHYENFLSHAKMIEKMAEAMEPGSGEIVSSILAQLLEHSHYSPPDEDLKALDGKTDEKSMTKRANLEKINELLTVKHNHHDHNLMGYEAVKHSLTDKSNVVFRVNSLLQLFGTQEKVENFQRSHTFPFPAMFNWKQEKIKEFLAGQGKNVDHDFSPQKKLISSQFFKAIREGNSPKLLDTAFEKELEKIQEEVKKELKNNTTKFIYSAIDVLKQYHFRVFSETELLPDFINSEVDGLSEWTLPTDSYKKNIALNLRELIIKNEISKEFVIKCLSDHEKNVLAKIDNKIKIWEADETNLNLILRISAIQVKQSRIAGLIATATKVDSVKTS